MIQHHCKQSYKSRHYLLAVVSLPKAAAVYQTLTAAAPEEYRLSGRKVTTFRVIIQFDYLQCDNIQGDRL